MAVRVSVVIATFNRLAALERLLDDLARQSLPAHEFEVVVVDDGSRIPVRPALASREDPYRLRALAQANAGQAAARHRGILEAEGDVVVIVDDDMRVEPGFLEAHLAAHRAGHDVVLGVIAPGETEMPLFERWHAFQLARFAERAATGAQAPAGADLATGNVSFARRLYLEVGGFDASLARSEDRELGIRFEKAGARFGFAADARTVHNSDHDSAAGWRARAVGYGIWDSRIAKKHPDDENADPWKFVFRVSPVSRPFLLLAAAAPPAGAALDRLALTVSDLVDRVGAEHLALLGTTFSYGLAYFRGVRREAGSLAGAARGLGGYLVKRSRVRLSRREPAPLAAAADLAAAVQGDFEALRAGRAKYRGDDIPPDALLSEAVTRIGLQMMIAVRTMRFLRDAGVPLGPQVASRLIRHVYGAEIHWDAELAPGTGIIHGVGLVVSHAARVGEGCVLSHNVTLGESVDPETRVMGAPTLGRNVHVGPGAVLLGPIHVGEGSKIMAGAVLARSVPPRSVVRPPDPVVAPRAPRRPEVVGRA